MHPLLFPLLLPLALPHVPHDDARDVLCIPAPGGGVELVAINSQTMRVVHSRDDGLSWQGLGAQQLELYQAMRLVSWPETSGTLVLIGTERGVWTYDPVNGEVQAANDGLPTHLPEVVGLAAPRVTGGPALLVTSDGSVYRKSDRTQPWSLLLATGLADAHACVAVAPEYDPFAPPGPERMFLAGIAGQLHLSEDGGASWSIQADFPTAATGPTDWTITALCLSTTFRLDGQVLVARSRQDAASPTGWYGECWRSADDAQSFTLALSLDSAARGLISTPVGPSGNSHFVLAAQVHPEAATPGSWIGVFRSEDGGSSWNDFGNYQDFFPEEPTPNTVLPRWYGFIGLAASCGFASDGRLWLGRPEGLYRSDDEGWSWRQTSFRSERQIRDLEAAYDEAGAVTAFGATYGSALQLANPATGNARLIDQGPLAYSATLSVSPNFALDGSVTYCGNHGVALWCDPAAGGANPFGASGWLAPSFNAFGYVRTIQFSPHYDGSGTVPGGDLAIFFSSDPEGGRPPRMMRTLDGGRTLEEISTLSDGSTLPHLRFLAIAPDFDAQSAAGRTDVFGATPGTVYRLDDTIWTPIYQHLGASFVNLLVDPSFSRPGNPRLYLASAIGPRILVLDDFPTGAVTTEVFAPGLEDHLLRHIAIGPDFASTGSVYASTLDGGVYRLDLNDPTPVWTAVGSGFPDSPAGPIALSPDFTNDRMIFVGTQAGIVWGQDLPGASWQLITAPLMVDDQAPELEWLSPNDPLNPQPSRAWEWERLDQRGLKAEVGVKLPVLNGATAIARYDQQVCEWEAVGRLFTLHTYEGPQMGRTQIELLDFASGQVLASTQVDLAAAQAAVRSIQLALPSAQAVRMRITALLGPGQIFGLDALRVDP